jgi:hypothetical protein
MELLLRKRDTQDCVPMTAEEVCEHYTPCEWNAARGRRRIVAFALRKEKGPAPMSEAGASTG